MKIISDFNFKKMIEYINDNELDGVFFMDNESIRNKAVKYISGHPMDANLLISKSGKVYLNPWDDILAKKYAEVDYVFPMLEYNIFKFFEKFKEIEGIKGKMKIEFPENLTIGFKRDVTELLDIEFVSKSDDSIIDLINKFRVIKTKKEIEIIKKVCDITNILIDKIGPFVEANKNIKEYDLAFYLLKEAKKLGAEKESFEFLTANSKRSWGIHAYPATSNQPLNYRGLALIDFGILYDGYISDVTVPMGFGPLTNIERKVVETVIKAHDEAIDSIKKSKYNYEVSHVAVSIIKNEGFNMPHSLGHGIGLDVHEFPRISEKPDDERLLKNWKPVELKPGMTFTIEPGIYDESFGGCRLEDDILITEEGVVKLTNSRFYHFSKNYID